MYKADVSYGAIFAEVSLYIDDRKWFVDRCINADCAYFAQLKYFKNAFAIYTIYANKRLIGLGNKGG
ncbi:hypothetical protein NX04_13175 [Xanthomonas vasicola]|nr:hypothetical protein NX05_18105 [Xanthomonas vasicola]KGR41646.1 hypothetical protein NX04_13175 [Xanthomonas vasicola]KGR50617.1 hypothetical protein NX07_15880 [Xanthomonas vasicola]KGR54303.1 hypothetical protein NX09_13100 [Xanthomonas vasicola]KGT85719.1 hypothetical protein OC00_01345 [Xanthomonas vasicola]